MKKYIGLLSATALCVLPAISFAGGDDAAAVARRTMSQVQDFKELAVAISYLIGIVLFIAGLWMLYKDSKQPGQGHAKNGLIAMLVGAALLVVTDVVEITANTGLGGNAGDDAFDHMQGALPF